MCGRRKGGACVGVERGGACVGVGREKHAWV